MSFILYRWRITLDPPQAILDGKTISFHFKNNIAFVWEIHKKMVRRSKNVSMEKWLAVFIFFIWRFLDYRKENHDTQTINSFMQNNLFSTDPPNIFSMLRKLVRILWYYPTDMYPMTTNHLSHHRVPIDQHGLNKNEVATYGVDMKCIINELLPCQFIFLFRI